MTKISLINLGCAKNEVDSEEMLGVLATSGYAVESSYDAPGVSSDADVIVINTCGFIESAKQQSIDTILEALERKERSSWRAACRNVMLPNCAMS